MLVPIRTFSSTSAGRWEGRVHDLAVVITRSSRENFRRGEPGTMTSVLEVDLDRFDVAFPPEDPVSSARTLPGAMALAEHMARERSGKTDEPQRLALFGADIEAEQQAELAFRRAMIEADRLAFDAGLGGRLAVEILPDLMTLAIEEGLLPSETISAILARRPGGGLRVVQT